MQPGTNEEPSSIFSTKIVIGPECARSRDKKANAVIEAAAFNAWLHADDLKRGTYVLSLVAEDNSA